MHTDIDLIQQFTTAHAECHLAEQENEKLVNRIIDSGILIEFRRWIRSLFIISSLHPKTLDYYKSSSARRGEERRHLINYYFIIHPFSKFNLFWEILMFFVYIYMLIVYSLDDLFMFTKDYLFYMNVLKFAGDLVYLADICHFFAVGYYDTHISKTVLNPNKIARSYLLGYFIIDVVAIFPSIIIPFSWFSLISETSNPFVMYLRFVGIIRLLRIGRWLDAMELISTYKDYSTYIHKTLKIFFLYAVILCALYFFLLFHHGFVRRLNNKPLIDIKDRYLIATLILMMVANGKGKMSAGLNYPIAVSTFLVAGFFLYLYLSVQLLQTWNTFIEAKTATSNVVQQIKRFMQYKGLPIQLRRKITVFFDFKFQHDFYHEQKIHYFVTDLVRNRIVMNLIKNNAAENSLFSKLPNFIIYKLVTKMKNHIYLEDDVIMQAGEFNDYIYFIFHGTVAVYGLSGLEICHLEDGAVFGELCLLVERRKLVTVVAVDSTETYQVKKSHLLAVLEEYPDVKKIVLDNCCERFYLSRTGYF